jgi:ubiquinone/menaquinone biosynthesis C-methylase UbiE
VAVSDRRRAQFVPWRSAGNRTDSALTADEVVASTGWVFDNRRGASLEQFVETGRREVARYLDQFGLQPERTQGTALLEIGSGIGRMTAAFTERFGSVYAADIDAAFLERCRETVSRHGRPERLRTLHLADGRTIPLPDRSVDVAFSYITLQHCERSDALSLVDEALRVSRGTVLLNFRSWVRSDVVLVPLGWLVRRLWRVPVVGRRVSLMRSATRLGWQANRLSPDEVVAHVRAAQGPAARITRIAVRHSHRKVRPVHHDGVDVGPMKRVNRSHWWLVVEVV